MSCTFCGKPCGGAHAVLMQVKITVFPQMLRPDMTREKQALGLAATMLALQMRKYEPECLERLFSMAEKASHKKTVARARELMNHPEVIAVAKHTAAHGFRECQWDDQGKRRITA